MNLSVYSTRIYDLVRDQPPRFGEATALGFVFLVVLLALALLYQWYLRGKSFTTVSGRGYIKRIEDSEEWRRAAQQPATPTPPGSRTARSRTLVS